MVRALFTILLLSVTAVLTVSSPASAIGGEGEAWPSFVESSSCGAQRVLTPQADKTGPLSREALLRGDFAALFGRSVSEARSSLVAWRFPGSQKQILVHPLVVPSLDRAAVSIRTSIADGRRYQIDWETTFASSFRTIGGSLRTSRHTYGTAFDVNSYRNPFRRDNVLETDIPDWWVNAFIDAGFCWGGMWIGSKDSMHFAWAGPAFGDMTVLPKPYVPLTDPIPFEAAATTIRVEPPEEDNLLITALVDINGNGALDVTRVYVDGQDLLIDASLASRRHSPCSVRRSIVPGMANLAERSLAMGFGDLDGRGGQDLWVATDEDGLLRITVRRAYGGFTAETSAVTSIPTPGVDAWMSTADFNADGAIDLFVVENSLLAIWSLDPDSGESDRLFLSPLPFESADDFFLGDFDLDNRPDMWAVNDGIVSVALASQGYKTVTEEYSPIGLPKRMLDIRAADYDGDGRVDLITFDGNFKRVWLGNTRLADGLPLEVWFETEKPECSDYERVSLRDEYRFVSSTWIAEGSYVWRTRNDLAVGCDPTEDGCTPELVTRLMFVEFLAWIDNRDGIGVIPGLTAARALAQAGFEIPCDLVYDECWDEAMPTAEGAAAFGRFLSARQGNVPPPHRWIYAKPSAGANRAWPQ